MIVFTDCKINIGLYVTRRREDGYHDLETVMLPVAWHDILEIVPGKSEYPTLTCTGRAIACDVESNIVMKAYRRMQREVTLPPLDMYLHKVVPDGAGLGGGSADAAYTLRAINEMLALGFSLDQLADMAADIGADCPLFIYDMPQLATGTGTTLTPINLNLHGYTLAVVKPEVSVSTREAYAGVTPKPAPIQLAEILTTLPPEQWAEAGVSNDFEKSILPRYPQIAAVKQHLYDVGAVYASMSGSGSAVFGLFTDAAQARQAVAPYAPELCHVTELKA